MAMAPGRLVARKTLIVTPLADSTCAKARIHNLRIVLVVIVAITGAFLGPAAAELIDRGHGLIYDTDRDLNTGPFFNVEYRPAPGEFENDFPPYWSSTGAPFGTEAPLPYVFSFATGQQNLSFPTSLGFVWPVHVGDIASKLPDLVATIT